MRRGLTIFAVAVLVATATPAGDAQSAFDCGDVIEESIKLETDILNCPRHGLVIGEGAITIDLNGHTIGASSDGAGAGIFNDDGDRDVVITDGTITGFDKGVLIDTVVQTRNVIEDLVFTGNKIAISIVAAEKNVVEDNELDNNDEGIRIVADGNTLEDNEIFDSRPAIRIEGDDNLVLKNEIVYPVAGDQGAAVVLDGNKNVALKNDVLAGETGIDADGTENLIDSNEFEGGAGDGVVVGGVRNEIAGNDIEDYGRRGVVVRDGDSGGNVVSENDIESSGAEGIFARGDFSRIFDNKVEESGSDGIFVDAKESRIRDNEADDNGYATGDGYGIFGDGDGTDGSGNKADDNANAQQCKPADLCE